MATPDGYRMSQTVIPSATGEKPAPGRASGYLLAYLEDGKARVYAPDNSGIWVGRQLPEAEEIRIETELQRLHETGKRTAVLEIALPAEEEPHSIRVLCVRA